MTMESSGSSVRVSWTSMGRSSLNLSMWAVSWRFPSATWTRMACFFPELAVIPTAEVDGRAVRPMGKADMGLFVISHGSPSKDRKEMESSPI